MNCLSALSLMNDGVREILPFIRYISQFIDFEFSAIKAQNRGNGVVCAATWIMPAAMVPRPWDFPEPPPPKPKQPEQSKEKKESVEEKTGDATKSQSNVNAPGAVPPITPTPQPAESGEPNSTMPMPMPGALPVSPPPSLPMPTMGPAISVASSTPSPEIMPATAREAIAPYVIKE
jgi:hypothetical protein